MKGKTPRVPPVSTPTGRLKWIAAAVLLFAFAALVALTALLAGYHAISERTLHGFTERTLRSFEAGRLPPLCSFIDQQEKKRVERWVGHDFPDHWDIRWIEHFGGIIIFEVRFDTGETYRAAADSKWFLAGEPLLLDFGVGDDTSWGIE